MFKSFKMSELGEFKNGANFPKGSYGKGKKIVNVKDLFRGRFIDFDSLEELKDGAVKNPDIYTVEDGDILFTRSSLVRSGAGMCCMVKNPPKEVLFCGFIIRFRITIDNIYPLYLLYMLRSPKYRKMFTGTQQTNITNINQDSLGKIEIMIPVNSNGEPDFNEQRRIVNIIDKIDTKIENNKLLTDKYEEYARFIYNRWFLQFEFPYKGSTYKTLNNNMIFDDDLNYSIPEEWKVLKIKDVIKSINSGLNPRDNFKLGNGDIKYVTVKNLTKSGIIDFDGCDYIDSDAKKIVHERSNVEKGDILFASIAPLGRCVIVEENPEDWEINESVFSIKPDEDKITTEYLYLFFMSDYFVKIAEHSSTGSIFSGIRVKTLENISVAIPPKHVLLEFNKEVNKYLKMKFYNEKENNKLIEIRDYLIESLLNKKIVD